MTEGVNSKIVAILLLGALLVGLGVLGSKFLKLNSEPQVEFIDEKPPVTIAPSLLTVEISGEVQKPGVYKLASDARVNDLLIAGGGLSAKADREWVEKNINLAQKVTDGMKVYVPESGGARSEKGEVSREVGMRSGELEKININTATEGELDTLAGVGPVTVKKIIDNRPYQKIEDLLDKKIVGKSVWERIKGEIVAW